MSNNSHTVGPWVYEEGMVFSEQGRGDRVCTPCCKRYDEESPLSGHQDDYQAAANGRLISAAPEMLECLEEIIEDFELWVYGALDAASSCGLNPDPKIYEQEKLIKKIRTTLRKARINSPA